MNDTITLTGYVATPPHQRGTTGNSPVVSFRLLSSQSHFDRAKSIWIDDDPNWYTVSAFRQLAANVLKSVGKGDRVIVTGRLRIHDWEASGRSGTNIDLNADAIGHDLCFGQTSYTRVAGNTTARSDWDEGSGTGERPITTPTGWVDSPSAGEQQREPLPETESVPATAQSDELAVQSDELAVPF